jgi:hypothetical protein
VEANLDIHTISFVFTITLLPSPPGHPGKSSAQYSSFDVAREPLNVGKIFGEIFYF